MSGGPLELRALVILVCASAVFTVLCPLVYRREPARRKLFLALLAGALLLLPWWGAAGLWTWPLGLRESVVGALAQPVPWTALLIWWSIGCALMLRTLIGVRHGRRRLLKAPAFAQPAVEAECRDIAVSLALAEPVSVREGAGPCASSLGALVLMLPGAARAWPAATRRAVLAHEIAHLKRRDDRLMLLIRLLTDWYWWMPWLGALYRRYVEAMEESCDDLASSLMPSRTDYVSALVQAARSLTPDPGAAGRRATWAFLFGHSHLAVRVQRLVAVPRPTLDHADGRRMLVGTSLAFLILLTARPSVAPTSWPDAGQVIPLVAAHDAGAEPQQRYPRVETSSFVLDPASGNWRRLPPSARDPLPIYPGPALASGVRGRVIAELSVRQTPAGLIPLGPPTFLSDDPSGLLTPAVERAFVRAGRFGGDGFGPGAFGTGGLGGAPRTVSIHNDNKHLAMLPPGTTLRLRKIYRFVPGNAAGEAATNGKAQIPNRWEVDPWATRH